jgi:hypothetical protein
MSDPAGERHFVANATVSVERVSVRRTPAWPASAARLEATDDPNYLIVSPYVPSQTPSALLRPI